jgi:hypothetical protein
MAGESRTEVALIVDGTLGDEEIARVRKLITEVAGAARRVAVILVGDHEDAPIRPERALPPYELRSSGFLTAGRDVAKWLRDEFEPLALDYLDIALECAIEAAARLPWSADARKLTLFLGSALPHNSSDSLLALRTGVDCTRKKSWRAELAGLQGIPHMALRAGSPLVAQPDPHDFANLLRWQVWRTLNGGRPPDPLDDSLPGRWVRIVTER